MRKKLLIAVACVFLLAATVVILWGWYHKGFPTTVSTTVVSPLPEGVSMELTEITKTGGVLVCLVDRDEATYYSHIQIGSGWYVEKLSEDGLWYELAEGKFPLGRRTDVGPSRFTVGESLVQINWKDAYGTLRRGEYRLVGWLDSEDSKSGVRVGIPFSVD